MDTKAIKTYKIDISNLLLRNDYAGMAWAVETVFDKQIPKKVYQGCCPICGKDGSDEYGHKKYCSECGQALDWGDK